LRSSDLIGTKTPRAYSGTVEEFDRAVKALKNNKKLNIWLYLRDAVANLKTKQELEQRKKVLAFKKRVQRKALTKNYKQPANFRDSFCQDLSLWFNKITIELANKAFEAALKVSIPQDLPEGWV
ncbi:hypothetical protein, partial [Moorena sp. SIO3I6]|uniref:hypothetical protein n=1 Tax=Moorena sp. SIO3I6 TaxID=2607831 RepID=UPI0013FBF7D6